MYMETLAVIFLIVGIASLFASAFITYRAKRQIADMWEALEDIRNGNGNRRILAEAHEFAAPIAWQINGIVRSYEDRLSVYRQAEETNKRLMTSLSHDVRTPLTTLIGYLDAVHKELVTGDEREDYMEIARQKAHDLKEYIDVLFDWFKLGSDEFSMNISVTDMTELTRSILIDWIPIFEDGQIEYVVEIPERPFWVKVDPDGYMRVVNNLIQNVIAHSGADRVVISLLREEGEAVLCVEDNGVGIEKEDLEHIFERLYKCDKGRSERGSGLGLAIVLQIVEKMGGSIGVESVVGKGTVFLVRFLLEG